MRYALTLSYDGTDFCGWQRQDNAPSVQEAVEEALSTLTGTATGVVGAGRTDSGVHARHYVAHFDAGTEVSVHKLNCILPKSIAVHSIRPVPDDFNARFSAISRRYRYYIHPGKDPFNEAYSWRCGYNLDIARMNEACALLIGEHDFSCFEKTGSDNGTSICTVFSAGWDIVPGSEDTLCGAAERISREQRPSSLVFTIEANRFLRNMVRAIVGTMVDIGRGRKDPQWINELLSNGTRSDAGQSVPGHALFLDKINYPEEFSL